MKLLIIRHAEPDYAVDGLTKKGHFEAELLSRRLVRVPDVTAIYQSPLGRAQLTASYTLKKLGRTAETLPWLAEFRGHAFDAMAGRERISWDYRREQWADRPELYLHDEWADDPMFAGSNVKQIWQETCDGVDALLARHGYVKDRLYWRCEDNRKDTLMLFCHFAVGTAVVAHLIGTSPMPMWHGLFAAPSAVTTVVTEERRKGEIQFRCASFGDVSHLAMADERWSTAGLFCECYDGRDSTAPIEWEQKED